MTKQDVFGIIVRTFGLYLMVCGLWYLVSLVVDIFAMIAALFTAESLELVNKLYYLMTGSGATFLGFLMLAKADGIVQWTYRHHEAKPPRAGNDISL